MLIGDLVVNAGCLIVNTGRLVVNRALGCKWGITTLNRLIMSVVNGRDLVGNRDTQL